MKSRGEDVAIEIVRDNYSKLRQESFYLRQHEADSLRASDDESGSFVCVVDERYAAE